jgi:hypothetical protein
VRSFATGMVRVAVCLCVAAGCADDRPGPPVPRDTEEDDAGRNRSLPRDAGQTGYTEVMLPCEGSNYAQLEGEVLTYTVWIHSENTDLTYTLATQERQTADAMTEVFRQYSCEQLQAEDPTVIEEQLTRALEQRYQDATDNPGVIDSLSLTIQACG